MSLLPNLISRRTAALRFLGAGAASVAVATKLEAIPQPHMQAARRALQNARGQLEMALPDKAGHRVRAIELLNQTIAEVEAGIAAGNDLGR